MSSDAELDGIQRRKMLELRRRLLEEQQRAEQQQRLELQKRELLRRILTNEARQRLNRIKMVKPEFAGELEIQLIQIAQSGRVRLPITDEQLKTILARLRSDRRETRIRRV